MPAFNTINFWAVKVRDAEPVVAVISVLTVIFPTSVPLLTLPAVIVTLVPASSADLIDDARMVLVAAAVKLDVKTVPLTPDAAIVTSYGSNSHMPPRPTLMAVSKLNASPDVSTKPPLRLF